MKKLVLWILFSSVSASGFVSAVDEYHQLVANQQLCALESFHRSESYLNHLTARSLTEATDTHQALISIKEAQTLLTKRRCLDQNEVLLPEIEAQVFEKNSGVSYQGCERYLEANQELEVLNQKMSEEFQNFSKAFDESTNSCPSNSESCSAREALMEQSEKKLSEMAARARLLLENQKEDKILRTVSKFDLIKAFPKVSLMSDWQIQAQNYFLETIGEVWASGQNPIPFSVQFDLKTQSYYVTREITERQYCSEASGFALRSRLSLWQGSEPEVQEVILLGNVKTF